MGSHPVLCLEPTHCGTARGPLCAGGSSDSHKATGREHKQEHTPVQALYRDSNLPPQKLPLIGRRLKSSLLEFGVGLVMPAGYSAAYSASKDLNLVRSSIKQQLAHCWWAAQRSCWKAGFHYPAHLLPGSRELLLLRLGKFSRVGAAVNHETSFDGLFWGHQGFPKHTDSAQASIKGLLPSPGYPPSLNLPLGCCHWQCGAPTETEGPGLALSVLLTATPRPSHLGDSCFKCPSFFINLSITNITCTQYKNEHRTWQVYRYNTNTWTIQRPVHWMIIY